jgi:hypothetical protein
VLFFFLIVYPSLCFLSNCIWCEGVAEDTVHLFLHCDLARNVWLNVMLWLDLNFIMPPNLLIHWECWSRGLLHKKIQKGLRMIWEVVIWVLWKARNGRIFNNEIATWDELVEEVKVFSWRWLLGRTSTLQVCFMSGVGVHISASCAN